MPNEHNRNDDLVSTEEAKLVIDLYAKKEQARLAEEKRIAAMPKLAEVAEMAGLSANEARRIAFQCRLETDSDYRIKLELDSDGEEHLSELDVKLLLAKFAEIESAEQKRIEYESKLISLQDIAQDLNVPVDEARDLLKDVRRRSRWAGVLYRDKGHADVQMAADKEALAVLALMVVAAGLSVAWFLRPSSPKPAAPLPISVTGSVYAPWHPKVNWVTQPTGFELPSGCHVTYNLSPGLVFYDSSSDLISGPIPTRLKTFFKTFRPKSIPGATPINLVPVPGYNVPLSPSSELSLSSDIAGWVAVTVAGPTGKRSVYLPDISGSNAIDTAAGLEYRLNYLAGLPAKPHADYKVPTVTKININRLKMPQGSRLTLCGRGQVFQTVTADPQQALTLEQTRDAAKGFLVEAHRLSQSTKDWKPSVASVNESRLTTRNYVLEYFLTYGTRSFDCTRLFNALDSGNNDAFAEAWIEVERFLESAEEAARRQQP